MSEHTKEPWSNVRETIEANATRIAVLSTALLRMVLP